MAKYKYDTDPLRMDAAELKGCLALERERLEDGRCMDLELPHLMFRHLPFDGHPCTLRCWHLAPGFALPDNVALVPSHIIIEQHRRREVVFWDGLPRKRRKAPGKQQAAKRQRAPQRVPDALADAAADPPVLIPIEDGAVESGGEPHASDGATDSESAESDVRDEVESEPSDAAADSDDIASSQPDVDAGSDVIDWDASSADSDATAGGGGGGA